MAWLEAVLGGPDDTQPIGGQSPRQYAEYHNGDAVRYLGHYLDKDGDQCFAYANAGPNGSLRLFVVYAFVDDTLSSYVPDREYPIPDHLLRKVTSWPGSK